MTDYQRIAELQNKLSDLCHELWLISEEYGDDSEEYQLKEQEYFEVFEEWKGC
jgi:hypothetical protein